MPYSALVRYHQNIPRVQAQAALAWLPAGQASSGWLKRGSLNTILNHLRSVAYGIELSEGLDALLVIHDYIGRMEKEGRAVTQEMVEEARAQGRLPEFLASMVDGRVTDGDE